MPTRQLQAKLKKMGILPTPQYTTKVILEAFNNDPQLLLFYEEWVNNGFNASAAYKAFHPLVNDHSARTLGSKELAKIDKALIMEAFGLNNGRYMQQLSDGLGAEKKAILRKYDRKTGNLIEEIDLSQPDHKVRLPYHDKLGVHLGLEQDRSTKVIVPIQNNSFQLTDDQLQRITE